MIRKVKLCSPLSILCVYSYISQSNFSYQVTFLFNTVSHEWSRSKVLNCTHNSFITLTFFVLLTCTIGVFIAIFGANYSTRLKSRKKIEVTTTCLKIISLVYHNFYLTIFFQTHSEPAIYREDCMQPFSC